MSSSSSSVTYPGLQEDAPRIQFGRSSEMLPTLSDDIIEEILVRLPVKSLIRFRCVCKFWNTLISSKNFIKTHLELSKKDTNYTHHSLISTSYTDVNVNVYSLRSILYVQSVVVSPVVCFSMSSPDVVVVGCCNGLCCMTVGTRFLLWNPSTRKINVLPGLGNMSTLNRGFGYDGSDDGYKVLYTAFGASVDGKQELLPNLYSFKTNSWKMVENFKDCSRCAGVGVFVDWKLHWLTMDGADIVTFDLKSEVGGLVAKPSYRREEYQLYNATLGELGGSLCLVFDCPTIRKDFWVLKDSSWVRLVTIPNVVYDAERLLNNDWKYVKPLCMSVEGEILFSEGSNFVIYDTKGNSRFPHMWNTSELERFYCFGARDLQVYVNVQSLVSPFPQGGLNE